MVELENRQKEVRRLSRMEYIAELAVVQKHVLTAEENSCFSCWASSLLEDSMGLSIFTNQFALFSL